MKERARHNDRAGHGEHLRVHDRSSIQVFLALARALWVDRLWSWIDRTSAQSRAKTGPGSIEQPGSLWRAHGDTLAQTMLSEAILLPRVRDMQH